MNQQRQFKSPAQQPQSPLPPPQPPMWSPPYQGAPPVRIAEMPSEARRYQPQEPPAQIEHQSICRRCGKEFGFLARLGHDKKDHYCRTCSSQIGQLLPFFRAKFLEVTRYGSLTSTDWMALQHLAAQERLDMQEALTFICKDAVELIQRSVAQAEANGGITDENERYIHHLLKILAIPNELALPILQRLTHSKQCTSIQRFNQAVMQAEAHSSITGETIQRIFELQKALAIPDEVAQPAFQWLVSSKQRKDIDHFDQAVAQAKAEDDITDETMRRIFELQKALAIPDEVARPAFQQLAQLRKRKKVQRFNQAVAQAEAEDDITDVTIQRISDMQRSLAIPDEVARPAFQRLARKKKLIEIRRGILPTVSTSVELEPDELCHLETPATYYKVNARAKTLLYGQLIATSKRLHFLSSERGFTDVSQIKFHLSQE